MMNDDDSCDDDDNDKDDMMNDDDSRDDDDNDNDDTMNHNGGKNVHNRGKLMMTSCLRSRQLYIVKNAVPHNTEL